MTANQSRWDKRERFLRALMWVHATYILITALWPIVHIESFMAVTGEKHDVWLVKTVGALLIPVAACLYSFLIITTDRRPAIVLGSLTCIAFATIDFYYSLNDVISNIYLADGAVELLFLAGWIYVAVAHRKGSDIQDRLL